MMTERKEEDSGKVPQRSSLTAMETQMVTQARARSLSVRGQPKLLANKAVSLFVSEGPLKGTSFRIHKPQMLIGRSDADIVVKDPKASRKHCALEVHGPTALLVDLDSANGTFVEEKRITSRELRHMDEFRVGETTLMFLVTERG
jgi:pSer/pThr/pTyr-binding forkhead associated (FHA) protein